MKWMRAPELFGKMADKLNGLEMCQVSVRHHRLSEQLSVLLVNISDWLFPLPLWLILYLGVSPSIPVLIEARGLGTSQRGLGNPATARTLLHPPPPAGGLSCNP